MVRTDLKNSIKMSELLLLIPTFFVNFVVVIRLYEYSSRAPIKAPE